MNTQSNAIPEGFGAQQAAASADISAARLMYWSVRRELAENRWLYLVPLGVAAVFLIGFFISTVHATRAMQSFAALGARHHYAVAGESGGDENRTIYQPYDLSAAAMMGLAILMGVFYSADALHGERRDRSILFWKSMPVSDAMTVLAKASVPVIVVPLLVCVLAFVMWWIMLLASSLVWLGHGVSPAALWAELPLFQMWGLLIYHIVTAHSIWPAPVYCWLLLVSGWARRAVLLWAALPVLVIGVLEKLAFNTSHFASLVGGRLIGNAPIMAQNAFPTDPLVRITAGRFLTSPGLWLGLAVSAVFLLAAVRLRRSQGAI